MSPITATDQSKPFVPMPEGPHPVVCIDVVDHGMVMTTWAGETSEAHKISLVFQNADGDTVRHRVTLSLHKKSALRPFLEAWLARKIPDDAAHGGIDLEKLLLGRQALVSVVHAQRGDQVYGNVASIMPLPKGTPKVTPQATYVRVKDRKDDRPIEQRMRQKAPLQPVGARQAAAEDVADPHSVVRSVDDLYGTNEAAEGDDDPLPF